MEKEIKNKYNSYFDDLVDDRLRENAIAYGEESLYQDADVALANKEISEIINDPESEEFKCFLDLVNNKIIEPEEKEITEEKLLLIIKNKQ
jgi:hypothetical protein